MKIKMTAIMVSLMATMAVCSAQTNQTTFDKVINLMGSVTNFSVEPYATYAPKAPTKFGGGALAVYNVNNSVGLGIGLDWLGQLSLVSANVTLQAPFHPLPSLAPSLQLSPFVLGGIGTAYSGSGNFNGNVSTIEDVGAYVKFGHFKGGQFNVGACWGKWQGVGPYDVAREHIFAGYQHAF